MISALTCCGCMCLPPITATRFLRLMKFLSAREMPTGVFATPPAFCFPTLQALTPRPMRCRQSTVCLWIAGLWDRRSRYKKMCGAPTMTTSFIMFITGCTISVAGNWVASTSTSLKIGSTPRALTHCPADPHKPVCFTWPRRFADGSRPY